MANEPEYTHRNGETEPPTVEGWYFLNQHGNAKMVVSPLHPLTWVIKILGEYTVFAMGDEIPAKKVKGKWWGPITLPWEQGNG